MRSGFVSIIGRPNVGKSTLINAIIGQKVAITSEKIGTTRNIIQGIYNEDGYQIVFVDTPGIHKPMEKLGRVLNKQAFALTKDVDVILFVCDVYAGIGKGDKYILDVTRSYKIDEISEAKLMETILHYKDIYPFAEVVPTSALKNDNINHLIDVIKKYLHDDVQYFPLDMYTSSTLKFMASEIVREKLLNVTEDEVPHSITCYTTSFKEEKNICRISIDIIVDKESLKKIIIGRSGARLKQVGTLARIELEELLEKKVYLELFVKVINNWKDKEKYLIELGFLDNE